MFVLLDALPLTPNGKVDRRALPDPADAGSRSAVAYVAPQSEIEHTIAQTWREVLDVEKIGRHDNFFDLGGHSLLMIRVQSKLREVLHRDLSIVDMFKYPTISALATYLGQAQSDSPPRHGDDRAEKRREGNDRQQRLRAQTRRGTKGAKEL
jgi:acyl carrier protein